MSWRKNRKTEESRIKAVRAMRRGHDDEPRNEILGRLPQCAQGLKEPVCGVGALVSGICWGRTLLIMD